MKEDRTRKKYNSRRLRSLRIFDRGNLSAENRILRARIKGRLLF